MIKKAMLCMTLLIIGSGCVGLALNLFHAPMKAKAASPDYYVAAPDSSPADKERADLVATSTDAIRIAITNWGPGKDILFLPGTYSLSYGIAVQYDGMTLRGAGDSTVFQWAGTAGNCLFYVYKDNCTIADMQLNGGGQNGSAVKVEDATGAELSGLYAHDFGQTAFFLRRTAAAHIHDFRIDHASFGMYIEGQNDDAEIHDFELTDMALWGMAFQTSGVDQQSKNFDVHHFLIDMAGPCETVGRTCAVTQAA